MDNSEDIFLGEYDLRFEDRRVGTLWVYPDGLKTVFEARCLPGTKAVCRLYCLCGDKRIYMGTMMPAGDMLKFSRSFTKSDLSRMGLSSVDGCLIVAERRGEDMGTTWTQAGDITDLFEDEVLKSCAKKLRGALKREAGGVTELAVPYDSRKPFAFMPAFCLGRPGIIDGNDFLLFRIRNGMPYIGGE